MDDPLHHAVAAGADDRRDLGPGLERRRRWPAARARAPRGDADRRARRGGIGHARAALPAARSGGRSGRYRRSASSCSWLPRCGKNVPHCGKKMPRCGKRATRRGGRPRSGVDAAAPAREGAARALAGLRGAVDLARRRGAAPPPGPDRRRLPRLPPGGAGARDRRESLLGARVHLSAAASGADAAAGAALGERRARGLVRRFPGGAAGLAVVDAARARRRHGGPGGGRRWCGRSAVRCRRTWSSAR